MRVNLLLHLFIFCFLVSACDTSNTNSSNQRNSHESKVEAKPKQHVIEYPEIRIYHKFGFMDYPLFLEEVDFNDSSQMTSSGQFMTEERIHQVISDFYFNDLGLDSAESFVKLKDLYLGTIRYHNRINEMYMVFLQTPQGILTSRLLFENVHRSENKAILEFNINTMYDFQDGKFTRSNLMDHFNIKEPIVVFTSRWKRGPATAVKLSRLWHNGTANALETTILGIDSTDVDTLSFDRKWFDTVND